MFTDPTIVGQLVRDRQQALLDAARRPVRWPSWLRRRAARPDRQCRRDYTLVA